MLDTGQGNAGDCGRSNAAGVHVAFSARAVSAYVLTFGASLAAAIINLIFGLLVAWVLVRYKFPGKPVVDALVDLPFALPTAVAGIALASLYAPNGPIGALLAEARPPKGRAARSSARDRPLGAAFKKRCYRGAQFNPPLQLKKDSR